MAIPRKGEKDVVSSLIFGFSFFKFSLLCIFHLHS